MHPSLMCSLMISHEPSRLLDAAVAIHLGWRPDCGYSLTDFLTVMKLVESNEFDTIEWIDSNQKWHKILPHWSKDFTQCLNLIPPHWRLMALSDMGSPLRWQASLTKWDDSDILVQARSHLPQLALLGCLIQIA